MYSEPVCDPFYNMRLHSDSFNQVHGRAEAIAILFVHFLLHLRFGSRTANSDYLQYIELSSKSYSVSEVV